jgi:arylsulfatase A-like enzyme
MKHAIRLALLTALLPPVVLATTVARAGNQRPNVVFVIVDDLNDLPLAPHGKPAIATPNIDRLRERGVSFTNAHTNDPICAPSRAAMMFGLYPQTTGLYWFENWRQNEILKTSVSLNRHLKNNGYSVFGTGKVYHIGRGDNQFDEFGYRSEFGPWPWDGKSGQAFTPHPAMMYMYEIDGDMGYKWEHHFGRLSMIPEWPADEANGIPGYKGWRLYGKAFRYVNSEDRDLLADELCANWSTEIIERTHDKPYALFCGLVRTHTPLYAPDEYFDRFPLDSIEIPETIEDDLDDCAEVLADRSLYGFRRYQMLVRHEDRQLHKEWLQAYLACVSFVDDQVGKILDAVDKSPQRDNTIIILTSDHGFHMGEKEFLYKQSLWDGATRVPLIVAGLEGMPEGATCDQPVSLIDIYPTINDLCDLPDEPNEGGNGYQLEGHSLRPLLKDPDGGWTGPDVAITALPGKDHSQHNRHQGTWCPHFSVRGKQFRYTLCANGEEELYDYKADPLEWRNLASDPEYAESKADLKAQLIELRDGRNWQTLDSLNQWAYGAYKGGAREVGDELHVAGGKPFYLATIEKFQNFELQFDLKSPDADKLRVSYHAVIDNNSISGAAAAVPPAESNLEGEPVEFHAGDWNHYRIRVLGDRCRVWINERLHSDVREENRSQQGVVGIDFPGTETISIQLRRSRIRPL